MSNRAAFWIISDSLYPFENENAPLGELTAAPHPREILWVGPREGPSGCATRGECHATFAPIVVLVPRQLGSRPAAPLTSSVPAAV